MLWLARQFVLASNGRDDDRGWVQLLVFIVLGVMYALGSLVKAKTNKKVHKMILRIGVMKKKNSE